jgi:hypothetical protein
MHVPLLLDDAEYDLKSANRARRRQLVEANYQCLFPTLAAHQPLSDKRLNPLAGATDLPQRLTIFRRKKPRCGVSCYSIPFGH